MDKLRQALNNCNQHVAKIGIGAELCKSKVFKITSSSSNFHFLNMKKKAKKPSKQNKVKFCPLTKASGKRELPCMTSLSFNKFIHVKPSPSSSLHSL